MYHVSRSLFEINALSLIFKNIKKYECISKDACMYILDDANVDKNTKQVVMKQLSKFLKLRKNNGGDE